MIVAVACGEEARLDPDGRDVAAVQDLLAVGTFAVDFVSAAATGADLNDVGEVAGTSYQDTGCGPFCLPPQDTVVWSGGDRFVLGNVAGLTGVQLTGIANDGTVVGYAGVPGTTTHAVVWKPIVGGYQTVDIGTLPGTTISSATGIDDLGRVVGWSTTSNFPPTGHPFLWTDAGGMVDLSALGFPNEAPLAISPNGMVATYSFWYSLDDLASVTAVAPPPLGFGVNNGSTAINDAGDQARFLVDVGAQNLIYLYRYHTDGTWQLLSPVGTGMLATAGVGSIDSAGTVTGTVLGAGVIAFGPDGEAESLVDLVSPAYDADAITLGGPLNETGDILTQVLVGASSRLVRLTPAEPCLTDCLIVDKLKMNSTFVQDPQHPGQCFQGGPAHDEVKVKVTVTDEAGLPVKGVEVFARFLDNYWTNDERTATTDSKGFARFKTNLPCGVGTTSFFVDDLVRAGSTFDRTTGTLVAAKIPQ